MQNMQTVDAREWLDANKLQQLDISIEDELTVYDLIACAIRLDGMGHKEDAWTLLAKICVEISRFTVSSPINMRALIESAFQQLDDDDEPTHAFGAF